MLRLAELLSVRAGGAQAFFCSSGAEANEAALKVARKATGRTRLVALEESFHGRTFGALSVTGQPGKWEGFGPLVPGVSFARPNDVESLEAAVSPGAGLAAIVLEPVLGEGGIVPLEPGFVQAAAEIAREVGRTALGRRGADRRRPHGDVLRLRAARHRARPRDPGEGSRQRATDRRASRALRRGGRDRPGRPRRDLRRQPGRERGGVRGRRGDRRRAPRERRRARRAAHGGPRGAARRDRGARPRADGRRRARPRGGPGRRRMPRRGAPRPHRRAPAGRACGSFRRSWSARPRSSRRSRSFATCSCEREPGQAAGDPQARPRPRDLDPVRARRGAARGRPRRGADDDLARRPRPRPRQGARAVRAPRLRGARGGRRRPAPRDRRRAAALRDVRRAGRPARGRDDPVGLRERPRAGDRRGPARRIAGTIAGDNTIFVAPRDGTSVTALATELREHLERDDHLESPDWPRRSRRGCGFGREAGRFRGVPRRQAGGFAARDPLLRIPCFATRK